MALHAMCLVGHHRYGPPKHEGDQVVWICGRCRHEKWFVNSYVATSKQRSAASGAFSNVADYR